MSLLTDIAGRFQWVVTVIQTPSPPAQPAAIANPARYAIGFAHYIGNTGSAQLDAVDGSFTGFIIPPSGIQWFTVKDHGSLAQAAWWINGMIAGAVVTVFEVIDNEA